MRSLFAAFLAFFAVLPLTGCKDNPDSSVNSGRPALWTIKKGDLDGWIFGTIHVLPKNVSWKSELIVQTTANADRLVLEVAELQDPQKTLTIFERMGRAPNLPPLDMRLPEADRQELQKIIKASGSTIQLLSGYKNWAAAMLLSAASQQELGVSASHGVEAILVSDFQRSKKPIVGLESVQRQFNAFNTLAESSQRHLLLQTVREANDVKNLYGRILTAWVKGDMHGLAREDEKGEQPDPAVKAAVFTARNQEWAKEIAGMKGRPFIAVGAGHLTGEDNIILLLQKNGFTINRVQ